MSSDTAGSRASSGTIGADVLDLYLDDVSRHDLLDPEEEERIARRARAGDEQALERLVRANLRFVISVAKKYKNRGVSFEDLIQEGNVGLVKAAKKFDPDQGVKFISYAVWWIRQSILSALARHSRSVRLPLNRATEMSRMLRTRGELRQELGRDPKPEEIADEADLDVDTVEMLQRLNTAEVRLDAPVGEEDDSHLIERFFVEGPSVEDDLEEKLLQEHVIRALSTIRSRDARVIRLYYGLQGSEEHTLEEIGEILGVTRERVRQLRDRGLEEIRSGELGRILASYAAA
ncbi:MAG: RNA polymerase sigma factor RpoD/SigA [Candidatus Palauibacterales bacterium]|nr:RNA polymerase sigma factor RpoD/SigA [Candidatus Palauibacterales bacterium]